MAKKKPQKQIIVTFKADESFLGALKGVHNRSEFIRAAVLTALDSVCPLCKGTGILSPKQKDHWATFAGEHPIKECRECHELTLVCANKPSRRARCR
jgi:hypothetical protein